MNDLTGSQSVTPDGVVGADTAKSGFAAGARVKISGLRSKPEYNDTLGTIEKYNEEHHRWKVRMDYDGSLNDIKEANLEIVT